MAVAERSQLGGTLALANEGEVPPAPAPAEPGPQLAAELGVPTEIRARVLRLQLTVAAVSKELAQLAELLDARRAEPPGAPGERSQILETADVATLSPREAEVLRSILGGRRVPSIARGLHLSPHTVRNHLKSIYRKLGVRSQVELIERFQLPR